MALVITYRSSVYSTGAAVTYTCAPTYTPAANSLLVAFINASLASSPTDPTAVNGHGVAFSKLTLAANLLGTTHILSAWVADAGASPSNAAVIGTWGSNRTGAGITEFEVTGWGGTDAANGIVQNPVGGTAAGTGGSVTLASAQKASNRPMSFFVHLANEATTPRASWTETAGADGNYNSPATGHECQFRDDAFETTASATWVGNVAWRGVALEIRAQDTTDQTITAKANITGTTDQTITARARITKTTDQTITAVANIATGTVTDQTITAKARITATADQTIVAKGRITATTDQTIPTRARITAVTDRAITAIGRITATTDRTVTAKANIQLLTDRTITAKANILGTTDRTITARGRIAGVGGAILSTYNRTSLSIGIRI